jgi:hypothetical protein
LPLNLYACVRSRLRSARCADAAALKPCARTFCHPARAPARLA